MDKTKTQHKTMIALLLLKLLVGIGQLVSLPVYASRYCKPLLHEHNATSTGWSVDQYKLGLWNRMSILKLKTQCLVCRLLQPFSTEGQQGIIKASLSMFRISVFRVEARKCIPVTKGGFVKWLKVSAPYLSYLLL